MERVCIQFPDPHFKMKHRKRRVVQPALVESIAALTEPGCEVFLQSDIFGVVAEMRDIFRKVLYL